MISLREIYQREAGNCSRTRIQGEKTKKERREIKGLTIIPPRVSSVAWAFLTSTVTFIIGFFVGLATSHAFPWAGRHGSYWLVGYRILDRLAVHRWLGAGRWRTRSKVRHFEGFRWVDRHCQGQVKWRQLTHSIPKPPDAWWLKDTSRVNDYNCITQMDTQPSQTSSEGYIFLLLYAPVVFLCISGEY